MAKQSKMLTQYYPFFKNKSQTVVFCFSSISASLTNYLVQNKQTIGRMFWYANKMEGVYTYFQKKTKKCVRGLNVCDFCKKEALFDAARVLRETNTNY